MCTRLAKGIYVIVAIGADLALQNHGRMAERHRRPAQVTRTMAGFTRCGGLNMGWRLGQGIHCFVSPAMASHTGLTGRCTVIHASRPE